MIHEKSDLSWNIYLLLARLWLGYSMIMGGLLVVLSGGGKHSLDNYFFKGKSTN